MSRYAHVTGWGMAVPDQVMTNEDLEKIVDTTDEWIVSRTGIRERRIAARNESTATIATRAAFRALDRTDLHPGDLDLVIVATASPEHLFPATACIVQDNIGALKAGAFDLMAACTGFIFALNMAAQAIRSGSANNALVIGAETLSRLINWEDRGTCILFGDGAGAFVLQASDTPGGILSCTMRSDGSGGNLLSIPAGGSRMPASLETVHKNLHTIHMNGREVFRFATRVMAEATLDVVGKAGLHMEDIALVVPHQANKRIIEAAARGLKLPLDRFMINLDRYGNTSSASIPIAVCEAFDCGRVRPGDNLVLVGFGAGLTWGAMALRWSLPERKVTAAAMRRRRANTIFAQVRSAGRRLARRLGALLWGSYSRGDG